MLISALCGFFIFSPPTLFSKDNKSVVSKPIKKITSDSNYIFSVTKPSEEAFVDHVARNRDRIFNNSIERAYKFPMESPGNAFIYALAMDYTLNDGSVEVLLAYQMAANAAAYLAGKRAYIEYGDFLLRTKRYDMLLNSFNPNMCYQSRDQCAYYVFVAKFLRDHECDQKYYNDAYKFSAMRGIVEQMCPQVHSN